VAQSYAGRGLGRALLSAVVDRCQFHGVKRLVAFIGDSDNAASIALHAALGFRPAGVLREIGFKHERWLDVVLMQRDLVL
jgi:phosphinothricin acetyltransferase